MKSIWSGGITFGLIYIPVKLYAAEEPERLHFHFLRRKDMCPVHYVKFCKITGEEVPKEEVVKGFEYEKGSYVILEDEDFERANVQRSKSIEIQEFINESELDPAYFERPYFLEPSEGAEKIYALLREALKKSKKIGIARFVLRGREHLAALKSSGSALILDQMRFSGEIRDPKELNLPERADISKEEMDMAVSIIDKLTKKFIPSRHKDTYSEELRKLINAKIEGREIARGKEPEPTRVADLTEKLKESLEQLKSRE